MERITFGLLLLALFSCCYADVYFQIQSYLMAVGGAGILKCESDAATTLEVYFKGTKLVTNEKYEVTAYPQEIDVRIKKVTLDDAGTYECRDSTGLKANAKVQILVHFVDNGKTFYAKINTQGVVPFTIQGSPRPEVTYKKIDALGAKTNVAKISSRGSMRIGADRYKIDAETGHLTILNVQAVDGGDYEVDANNLGQSKTGKLKLIVGDSPKITSSSSSPLKLVGGKEAIIECKFEEAPDSVKWEYTAKGKPKVEVTASSSSGGLTLDGTNLKIASVTIEHEGAVMSCIGTNRFGTAKADATIQTVYVKPVITALKNKNVAKGEKATLVCVAKGNPNPSVTWYKMADTPVKLNGQKQEAGNSSFEFESVAVSDAGTYQCVAKLTEMASLNDTATMTLTVLTKPMIDQKASTSSETFPVGGGKTKDLVCVASGNPAPSIKFMKNEQELTGAVSTTDGNKVTSKLKHAANDSSDGGVITCVASNSVGNATHDINVNMLEKPIKPTGLAKGAVERTSVELTWNAVPGADYYRVIVYQQDRKQTKVNRIKIEKLLGGTTYKFAVVAVNLAGDGEYSDYLEVTTQKFDKPSEVVIDPLTKFDKNDITLKWEKPANDGGDPALEYSITYCPMKNGKPGNCKTAKTNDTSIMLKGLEEDTEYLFTIVAKNQRGPGMQKSFSAQVGSSKAPPTTAVPKTTAADEPEKKEQKGLRGGAIAGIIIAVILILLIVIDLFCCFFNDCGLTHRCYQACCLGKGKGAKAEGEKDPEKVELKDETNDHGGEETKTAPEEKEELSKEKKTEDV